jgi:acyl-CoA synthetase (AMP-forming)/AMP-acid ligase II
VEGYGLSEATVASTLTPLTGPRKAGTVGVVLAGQEIRVVDDDRPLPAGAIGEVVVRGPVVMRGYLGRPDDTAAALRGGWLHTGDIGRLDDDGHLSLVDRAKDTIFQGGKSIYPTEIENILYAHPDVSEVAVVGRPHPVHGEEPVAFVVLRPGAATDEYALLWHCHAALAKSKWPREIYLRDRLPKNAIGKVLKGSLRDSLAAASGHGYWY